MSLFEFMRVCPNWTKIMLKDYNGEILIVSDDKVELENSPSYSSFYQNAKVVSFSVDCSTIYIKLKFLVDHGVFD